jgi:hypothetical protein
MSQVRLSSAARKMLRGIQQKLKACPQVDKPLSSPTLQEILAWCREFQLHEGSRCGSKYFTFDALFLKQIEKTLKQLGQHPLAQEYQNLNREDQAASGLDEYKQQGEKPREQRILVNQPAHSGDKTLVWILHNPQRITLDLDWREVDLTRFGQLLVVENLDSFYSYAEGDYGLPEQLNQALVVYRGDQLYASGLKQLKNCWRATGKPCLYLGDFDAKGVNIALNEGYTHLLLPPLSFLKDKSAALHQPEQQLLYQKSLRQKLQQLPASHPLVNYLHLLVNEQRGLKQQWFRETRLELLKLK